MALCSLCGLIEASGIFQVLNWIEKMLFTPFFKPSLLCSCWAKSVTAHLVCMRLTARRGCKLPLFKSLGFKRRELCSWLHLESLQLLQFHFTISASDLLFNLDNRPRPWYVLMCFYLKPLHAERLTEVHCRLWSDLLLSRPPGLPEQHPQQKGRNAAEDRRVPAELAHAAWH